MILTTLATNSRSDMNPVVGIKLVHPRSPSDEATVPTKKRKRTVVKNIAIKPADYARSAFKANGCDIQSMKKDAESFFVKPTQEMIDTYKPEILNAVRKNDLQKVKELYKSGTLTTNCCNKFGESLLHLSCRRGYTSIVRYLLEEVKVNANMRDDYNRTPLHDACWTTEPVFDLVDLLIQKVPHQLIMEDVRGFTPFDYVRAEHRGRWLRFLWERKAALRPLESEDDKMAVASVLSSLRS